MYWMKRCYFYLYLSRPQPFITHLDFQRSWVLWASWGSRKTEEWDMATWLWISRSIDSCMLQALQPYVLTSLRWFSALSDAFRLLFQSLGRVRYFGKDSSGTSKAGTSVKLVKGGLGWNLNSLGHICMIQSSCFKWVGMTTKRDRITRFYLLRFQTR